MLRGMPLPARVRSVLEGGHNMRVLPAWMAAPITASGEWLARAGLALPVMDPESAILIGLQRNCRTPAGRCLLRNFLDQSKHV